MNDPRPEFVRALQQLMREHGISQIAATNDGSVLIEFTCIADEIEFFALTPDDHYYLLPSGELKR
jgi:hypothetical protein